MAQPPPAQQVTPNRPAAPRRRVVAGGPEPGRALGRSGCPCHVDSPWEDPETRVHGAHPSLGGRTWPGRALIPRPPLPVWVACARGLRGRVACLECARRVARCRARAAPVDGVAHRGRRRGCPARPRDAGGLGERVGPGHRQRVGAEPLGGEASARCVGRLRPPRSRAARRVRPRSPHRGAGVLRRGRGGGPHRVGGQGARHPLGGAGRTGLPDEGHGRRRGAVPVDPLRDRAQTGRNHTPSPARGRAASAPRTCACSAACSRAP